MKFAMYVERQRGIIRERHTGEEQFFISGEYTPVKSSEQLLRELGEMKGLNKPERAAGFCIPRR